MILLKLTKKKGGGGSAPGGEREEEYEGEGGKGDLEVESAHPAKRQRTDVMTKELVSFLTSQGGSATSDALAKNFKKLFKKQPELKDQLKQVLAAKALVTKHVGLDGEVRFHLIRQG